MADAPVFVQFFAQLLRDLVSPEAWGDVLYLAYRVPVILGSMLVLAVVSSGAHDATPAKPLIGSDVIRSEFVTEQNFTNISPDPVEHAALVAKVRPRLRMLNAVLKHLESQERSEPDAWRRDDLRIAWLTTLYAWRNYKFPAVSATYSVLGIHPEKVGAAIEARREALMGRAEYAKFLAESEQRALAASLPAKKPVVSVGLDGREQAGKVSS